MAGEALISFVAEAVLSKLVSFIAKEITLAWGLKADLKTLGAKSTMILALLRDAGDSQVKGEAVTLWLKNLKNAAYDADDLLDEFAFEMLGRKLEIQNRMKNKVRSFFSVSNPMAFRFKMAHKIKDVNRMLDQVIDEGAKLGLQQVVHQAVESSRNSISHAKIHQTQPFVDDSKVFGRDADISKVVSMLLQTESEVKQSIVAIVGLAGLGKTTLTQAVFKDERVMRNFSQRIWVCVSDDFNVTRILKEMAESLMLYTGEMSNIQAMIQRLAKELEGKKYLLVLDDVWETKAQEWDLLRDSLLGVNGSVESRILVTTRSDKVVLVAETLQVHHLERLSEDDSWSIFQQRAFASGGAKQTPYLIDVGRKIVERCRGVPLALKTLGALMHSREEHEWMSIEESNLWNLSDQETGIMPALRLSFEKLPLWSKQCFAYCSIFPKDFDFERDNLIQLWIAQGFVQPPQDNNLVMEDVGNDYFKSLLWISFFQDAKMDKYGNITHCKMHDLVHDLVQLVSKSECLALEANKVKIDDIEVRHLALGENEDIVQTIPKENAKRFRTLSLASYVCDNFLMKTKYLRVLMLKGSKIKVLPTRISKLKHLRYIDVSDTKIAMLPVSVTKLYNLQTLRLLDCKDFEKFPEGLENLASLRHLYFNGGKMPSKIGQLTCLQTLPHFRVCEDKGRRIEELGPLCKLRSPLTLTNIEVVRDKEEASRAMLPGKTNLYKLSLLWAERESADNDEDVLEGLQPPPNLKKLTIQDFLGSKFPSWMTLDSLNNNGDPLLPQSLVKIKLIDCKKCEHVPTLGELPFLRFLLISGMPNVKCIGTEFYSRHERGASSSNNGGSSKELEHTLFPALERLILRNMNNLVEWTEVVDAATGLSTVFPRLQILIIRDCHKLMSIPSHFPSLTEFCIINVESGVPLAQISRKVTTLSNVYIKKVFELTTLPEGLLQNNKNNLTCLRIKNCKKLCYIPPDDGLRMAAVSLIYLKIKDCSCLKFIPSIHGLTSLRTLLISKCHGLANLPSGIGTCTSLEKLRVVLCANLISFPAEDLRELKSLSILSIGYCPNLKSLPFEEFPYNLTRLVELTIGGFSKEHASFPFMGNVDIIQQHSLRIERLTLIGWPKLKSLPDQVQHLPALRALGICQFDGLEALPEWLGNFSSLLRLGIFDCENLKYMPSAKSMRRLTNLQELRINGCSLLAERCNMESGPESEWSKISHFPVIRIDDVVL